MIRRWLDTWPISFLRAAGCRNRITRFVLPLLMGLWFTAATPAQVPWQATTSPVVNRILMLAPREYQQQLRKAEDAIEREQYSEAIQALAQLLEPSPIPNAGLVEGVQEDFFIGHPGDAQLSSSLRTEARRLLGRLPARGKALYRLNYGAEAQRRFDEALREHDDRLLSEVAWRYFHTDAGYLANLLLGRDHLDRGRPLAASMCFARLAESPDALAKFDPELSLLLATSWHQSGNPDRAREVLLQLKDRMPAASFTLGGQTVPLFTAAEDPLDWLEQHLPVSAESSTPVTSAWRMHRGLPSRNPATNGGLPLLRHRWRVPLASTPDDEEQINSILNEQREQGTSPIASVTPLVVDDVILMRTPENMLAVDFHSGKRIWEYPWADPPSVLLSEADVPARNRQQRRAQLEERLWKDAAYGQLASNGKCVYLLDELSYVGPGAVDPTTQVFRNIALPDPNQPKEYNSLVALELATQGKYRWRVGGANGEDEPALARVFFLGAPLVLADTLYVLGEVRGDVSLYVLDADTGHLRWSQQLAHVGVMNVVQDMARRLAGATPSYSDGVLVCPTSAGAIVAIDIPTRSLLWGYQYPRSFMLTNGSIRLNFARARTHLQRNDQGSWLDGTAVIAEGHVIVTPVESDELICLDLLTGKPAWTVSRDDNLLLTACVYDGQVIVIGDTKIVSLGLDDGGIRWTLPIGDTADPSAPTERPAGRGFLTGNHYFLPTTACLLAIDLDRGEVTQAVELSETLGNLVPYGDQIVSLSAESLTTFYQVDRLNEEVQQQLALAPHDPWSLEHRGMLQLNAGQRVDALQSLREAYNSYAADDDRREGTRLLLVETLLAVLEEDDQAPDDVIREVDALIERPLQRDRFLRLIGQRMLRERRALDAFKSFLELARQQDMPTQLAAFEDARLPLVETGDRNHVVRRDRFVRSGLIQALQMANDGERAQLEELIRQQRDQALAAARISRLHDFLRVFGEHPLADPVRLELARRYIEVGELLQVEQLISPILKKAPSPLAGDAWVLMARIYVNSDRDQQFDACLEQLSTHWSSEPLSDGRTGQEWADELAGKRDATTISPSIAAWPYGRVHVERLRSTPANLPSGFQPYSNYRPIHLRGSDGVLPARLRIAYDNTGTNNIVITDSLGRERVHIPGTNGRIKRFVDGTLTSKSLGHLVLINFGHGVLGVNALESRQPNDQLVLWPKNYAELLDGVNPRQPRMQSVSSSNKWGQSQLEVSGRRVHTMGPVDFDGVIYLQGNSLHCVDPLQGQPLWIRHDVPAGVQVWGDDQFVFVTPSGSPAAQAARVFRFLDGEELESRSVPGPQEIWSTIGRTMLVWNEVRQGDEKRGGCGFSIRGLSKTSGNAISNLNRGASSRRTVNWRSSAPTIILCCSMPARVRC